MATVSVLAGGISGFTLALLALFVLQFGWLAALGVWSVGGMTTASLIFVAGMSPRHATRSNLAQETA